MSRWIPVEEKMPDKIGAAYLVTVYDEFLIKPYRKFIDVAIYEHGMFLLHGVIAWMPLPKPYNPEEPEHPDCASCPVQDVNCYEQCRRDEKRDAK